MKAAQLCVTLLALVIPARAKAHEGWGIVRDAHGRIYISDIPGNTIWRIDVDGRIEPVVADVHSHALVVGADGAIYGTHVHLTEPIRSVWRLDMSGRLTTLIGPTRGLALDLQPFLLASDGTIYSASLYQPALPDAEKQLFLLRRSLGGVIDTVAGGLRGSADGAGADARFTAIDGMAWLRDSSMLVIDGARLRRVTKDGVVQSLTGPISDLRWDQDLMGASVAPDGSIYVADFSRRRIHRVIANGTSTATGTGLYWSPTGVLATVDGIYVLEHPRAPFGILGDLGVGAYARVRLIRADGSAEVIGRVWGRRTSFVGVLAAGLMAAVVGIGLWRRK